MQIVRCIVGIETVVTEAECSILHLTESRWIQCEFLVGNVELLLRSTETLLLLSHRFVQHLRRWKADTGLGLLSRWMIAIDQARGRENEHVIDGRRRDSFGCRGGEGRERRRRRAQVLFGWPR